MIERFAVRPDLNFLSFSVVLNFGFIGDEFVMLGKTFDLHNLSLSRLTLQALFHRSRKRIEGDLLLDLDDSSIFTHRDVFGMSADHHLGLIVDLTVFFLLRETLDGCALALRGDCSFDGRRQICALKLFLVVFCKCRQPETHCSNHYHLQTWHFILLSRGGLFAEQLSLSSSALT